MQIEDLEGDQLQRSVMSVTIHQAMPSIEVLREEQHADAEICKVFAYHDNCRKKEAEGKYRREAPYTFLHDGVLFYRTLVGDDESLAQAVLLPEVLIPKVMKALHDSPTFGHPGIKATTTIVRMHAYWKHMVKHIRAYVKHCETCIRSHTEVRAHAGLQVCDIFTMPWETCGIDMVGPLPRCGGDCYILHLVCWATGFNYIDTLPDKSAKSVAAALHKCFLIFGQPRTAIVTDNGTEFVNAAFELLVEKWGCKQIKSTPYHPKGNSRTERRHRDMNTIMRTTVNRYGESWKTGAYLSNWCLNVRPRTDSTFSPFQMLMGYQPKVPNDVLVEGLEGLKPAKGTLSDAELIKHLDRHKSMAMHHVKLSERECNWKNKLNADDHRYSAIQHKIGDLVLLTRPKIGRTSKGTATRLIYQQIGPFEVTKYLGNNVYQLRKVGTTKLSSHNVQYMNPYLSKEQFEEQVVQPEQVKAKANGVTFASDIDVTAFVPQPDMFMLYVGMATDDKPFHLVKVVGYEAVTDEVEFQWCNNSPKQGPNVGHRPCWVRIETDDDEVQSIRHPGSNRYKPMLGQASLDDFCKCAIEVKQSNASAPYRLLPTTVSKAMSLRTVPTLAVSAAAGARVRAPYLRVGVAALLTKVAGASSIVPWCPNEVLSRTMVTPPVEPWRWHVLPMGLTISPAEWQHDVDASPAGHGNVLSPLVMGAALLIGAAWAIDVCSSDDDESEAVEIMQSLAEREVSEA